MSTGWSIYVIAIVALNIVGCGWLLWWTARRRPGDSANAETTGHVWDGDLTEFNKPLPRWWINLFWLTIVFSIAYLVWYPGLGNFAGKGGWSSQAAHAAEAAEAEKQLAQRFAGMADMPLAQIAQDPSALDTGRRIFVPNCAMCHGSDGRGGRGFPNLTDASWQWGGTEADILASVLDGRQAQMPALENVLGNETAINATAIYVQGLSGLKVSEALAKPGQAPFESICAACHGKEGHGNPKLGAPSLADDVWLYGDRLEDIVDGIKHGHDGQMPAHRTLIGPLRARLAAAYVVSLGKAPAAPGGH